MVARIKASVDAAEAERIAERVRRARQQAAERGGAASTAGAGRSARQPRRHTAPGRVRRHCRVGLCVNADHLEPVSRRRTTGGCVCPRHGKNHPGRHGLVLGGAQRLAPRRRQLLGPGRHEALPCDGHRDPGRGRASSAQDMRCPRTSRSNPDLAHVLHRYSAADGSFVDTLLQWASGSRTSSCCTGRVTRAVRTRRSRRHS